MREFSRPPDRSRPQAPPPGNLADDVVRNGEGHPEAVVFSRRTPDGWSDVTAADFLDQVRRVARGLVGAGVAVGDRVALLSRTRFEWTLLDYAAWYVGAVTVPVYDTSSDDQITWILADAEPSAVVVETAHHRDRLRPAFDAARAAGRPLQLWTLDDAGAGAAVEVLSAVGSRLEDVVIEARRAAVGADDLATIVYTSGTTGRPKGCRITHANLHTEVEAVLAELAEIFEADGAATLLLLPLAHILGRITQVGAFRARIRVGHVPDLAFLTEDLRTFDPTYLLGVPRMFEKLVELASQRAAATGQGASFDRAVEVAIRHSRAQATGRVPARLRAQRALMERLVYRHFRMALGSSCRVGICGGAPLGERLGHFYRGAGVPIVEGWGLTETSGAAAVGSPEDLRIGTVGRPLRGTSVRVSDDGELQVRGGHVTDGYWQDSRSTREAFTSDGWLRTGDLGEIDEEGFVRVTGRLKELLVTTGGKNISPGPLEDALRSHPFVAEALVVGDGRPYAAALLTLERDAVLAWARRHDKPASLSRLVTDPDLLAVVQEAVDRANSGVSRAEAVRRHRVLPGEWTEAAGLLTPSLKVRRREVMRAHRDDISALYT